MIDDKVGHHVDIIAQFTHIVPVTQSWVNLPVVDRIETGISAINGIKEGKKVHSAEKRLEGAMQYIFQPAKISAHAIDIGDELDLIFQIYLEVIGMARRLHSAYTSPEHSVDRSSPVSRQLPRIAI